MDHKWSLWIIADTLLSELSEKHTIKQTLSFAFWLHAKYLKSMKLNKIFSEDFCFFKNTKFTYIYMIRDLKTMTSV